MPPDVDINKLNKYFADMGQAKDIDENELEYFRTHMKDGIGEGMRFRMVTEEEVKNSMNGVKSRAVGTDKLSIDMIRAASPYALGAITHLINASLSTSKFPQGWKTSIIHPQPKVTNPTEISQFRPISI